MYEIEKGIPIPAKLSGRKPKYPFGAMEIDDTFFVPSGEEDQRDIPHRLAAVSCKYGSRHGKKFAVRKVTVNGVTGARVWRTG